MWKARPLASLAALLLVAGGAFAQGSGGPLTIQGLHQHNNHSAASRAFGGVTVSSSNIGLMFVNPASMHALGGLQISVGGSRQYRDWRQNQHFAPVRYYPNLSLLLEGLTDRVPDPDPDLVGFTPADSVQRPFDDIGPDWSRSNTSDAPLHALVAFPFSLGGFTLTAGLGAVQYANLNHFYQNNNVLDPAVLSQRPLPTLRPTDNNPVSVDWYQSIRSREGSTQGYGAALAGHVNRLNLTVGLSGMLLTGNSDDFEQRVNRGTLTFYSNAFRADSSFGRVTANGTSEFSGVEFAISSILHGRFVSAGFVLRPPSKYTRTFQMEIEADTSGSLFTSSVHEEDQLQLPWRGSLGLLFNPHESVRIGLEYEWRPYSSATFTGPAQNETAPWRSSSLFRIGTEYKLASWLVLRGGMRGEAEVFVPEGSAIQTEPVSYRMYSAGLGIDVSGVRWNVTYENAHMKYQDIWGSALSSNSDRRHAIITDISYTIPIRR